MLRCLPRLGALGMLLVLAGCGDSDEGKPKPKRTAASGPTVPAPPPPSVPAPAPPEAVASNPAPPAPSNPGDPPPVASVVTLDKTPSAEQKPPEPEVPPLKVADAQAFDVGGPEGRSMARLRKLAQALIAYHDKTKALPTAAIVDFHEAPLLSWRVELLPLLGEENLYKEFRRDEPWDSPHNKTLIARMPEIYQTPDGPAAGEFKTCYLVPQGPGTLFSQKKGVSALQLTDDPDKTVMLVEADPDQAVVWTQPKDLPYAPTQPLAGLGRLRDNAFLAAFADAAVRRVAKTLPVETLRGMFTYAGQEEFELAAAPGVNTGDKSSPAQRPGLMLRGEQLLACGRQRDALNSLMAEGVLDGHRDVMQALRWSPDLRRPVLGLRFGIGGHFVGAGLPKGSQVTTDVLQLWSTALVQPLVQRLENRLGDGAFGTWLKKREGNVEVPAGMAEEAVKPVDCEISPAGVVTYAATDVASLRRIAQREGVDVLVDIAITVKILARPRTAATVGGSTLWVRLWDVQRNDFLPFTVKPVSSIPAGQEGKETNEHVGQSLITEIVGYLDDHVALTDMPPITPELARQRARYLLDNPSVNFWQDLLEIAYYQQNKLLTEREAAVAYVGLTGSEEARCLAGGPLEQRRALLRQFLTKGLEKRPERKPEKKPTR